MDEELMELIRNTAANARLSLPVLTDSSIRRKPKIHDRIVSFCDSPEYIITTVSSDSDDANDDASLEDLSNKEEAAAVTPPPSPTKRAVRTLRNTAKAVVRGDPPSISPHSKPDSPFLIQLEMASKTKLETLLRWFEDNEIEWDKQTLEVRDTNNSLGVFAKQDIEEGCPVVKIPKISILSAKTTGIANVIEDEHLEGGCSLALAVMYETAQAEDSPWYGYLKALPVMEDLPVFWTEDEQSLLKGTEMEDAVKNDMQDLRDDYEKILLPLFEKYNYIFPKQHIDTYYSFDSFCKTSTLVASRAFEVDAYHENAMVPFADIFNHRSGDEHVHFETDYDVCDACGALDYCEHRFFGDDSDQSVGGDDGWADVDEDAEEDIEESAGEEDEDEVEGADEEDDDEEDLELQDLEELEKEGIDIWKDDEDEQPEKDTCDLVMDRPAKKGEELFNTYGEHPNMVLLSKYGFCEGENNNDFVTVDEDMVVDTCVDQLTKLLKEKGIKATEEQVVNYVRMRWEFFIMNESMFLPDEEGDSSEENDDEDHNDDGCGCGHKHEESGHSHNRKHGDHHGHEHEHHHEGGCCDHDHDHDHEHEHEEGEEDEDDEEEEEPYRPRPYHIQYDGTFEDSLKCLLHIVFVDEQMFSKFVDNVEMAMGYFAELADSEQTPKKKVKKGKKPPVDVFANVKRNVNHVLHQLVLLRQKAYTEAQADGDVALLEAETNQRKRYALMCRISEKQILTRALKLYQ
ncbi:hypothetical protein Unana1_03496 [Umbelopsis nana]